MLSVAQETDRLNSVMKNLSETQNKFLSGDISQADAFKFIEDNIELFEQEGMIERFLAGDDISREVISQLQEQYDNYGNRLIAINKELEELEGKTDEESEARRRNLITWKSQVLIGMEYQGILSGLTDTQYKYNSVLEAYNKISELGLENDSLRFEMLESLTKVVEETVDESFSKMSDLEERLKEDLETNSLDNYIDFMNGIAIINTETYRRLDKEQKAYIDNFVNNFNNEADNVYNIYKELRDKTLEVEKEAADKKKKVYEDYFAALDRIEEKTRKKNN